MQNTLEVCNYWY